MSSEMQHPSRILTLGVWGDGLFIFLSWICEDILANCFLMYGRKSFKSTKNT